MSKNLNTVEDILQLDVTELNQIAEDKGRDFVQKHGINTNQVRNIFGAIVKMRNDYDNGKKGEKYQDIRREMILLKPKLAYAAAKQQEKMGPFMDTFTRLIDLVENSKDQEKAASSFFEFFEAVVAYHKFYEEKKKKSKN